MAAIEDVYAKLVGVALNDSIGVKPDFASCQDRSFFQLGGDSYKVVAFILSLTRTGRSLHPNADWACVDFAMIGRCQTISALCQELMLLVNAEKAPKHDELLDETAFNETFEVIYVTPDLDEATKREMLDGMAETFIRDEPITRFTHCFDTDAAKADFVAMCDVGFSKYRPGYEKGNKHPSLSFIIRAKHDIPGMPHRIVGGSLNMEPRRQPLGYEPVSPQVQHLLSALEHVENPVVDELYAELPPASSILDNFILWSDHRQTSDERNRTYFRLNVLTKRLASDVNYAGVVTTNTSETTKLADEALFDFKLRNSYKPKYHKTETRNDEQGNLDAPEDYVIGTYFLKL